MKSYWNFNICTINRTIYKDLIKFRATARYESVAVVDQNGPPDQDKRPVATPIGPTSFVHCFIRGIHVHVSTWRTTISRI